MSISEDEQQALDTIEEKLMSTGPKLTAMLATFARLTAGEEMPPREQVQRAVTGAASTSQPGRPRHPVRWLHSNIAWLACLAAGIAVIALALTYSHGAGEGACPAAWTAACRQASETGNLPHGGASADHLTGHPASP